MKKLTLPSFFLFLQFSYGKEDDSDEKMVGEDAYFFLQAFFQSYPEYASSPLYIVGESYGGHYAPA